MARPIPTIDNPTVEQRLNACVYLDVRTEQEFALGHVPGAYNLPVQLGSLAGLRDNPDFDAVACAVFPANTPLVVGCHSGGRALRAARRLFDLGFSQVEVHLEGWDGHRDAFGRKTAGWKDCALPTEQATPPERSYPRLLAKAQGEAPPAAR